MAPASAGRHAPMEDEEASAERPSSTPEPR